MEAKKLKIIKTYSADGMVFGTLWDNSEGAYGAKTINAKTKKKLIEEATNQLKDGSLDNGMGFQRLKGARLVIKETSAVIIDNRQFTSERFESVFIGDLTRKEKEFLKTAYFY